MEAVEELLDTAHARLGGRPAADVVHEDGPNEDRVRDEGVDAEALLRHLHQQVAILREKAMPQDAMRNPSWMRNHLQNSQHIWQKCTKNGFSGRVIHKLQS